MHRPESDCPAPERLRAFASGDVPAAELDVLAEHIDGCAACAEALERAGDAGDGLLGELAQLDERAAALDAPVPAQLVHAARAAGSATGGLRVDAGRGIAQALADGAVRLDGFELEAELGHGSFGYVFRARDIELGRIVAIKIQRARFHEGGDADVRFLREARSVAQLEHPGIVTLYATGRTSDGAHYLVTEFVDGDTLETHGEPVEVRHAADVVAQVAEALQYAHEQGVIHRDLKPSNILLDTCGRAHVLDFGLAKLVETRTGTMTPTGEVLGTPAYMSPEQARGDSHRVDARSDVYSLGALLYELLTGGPPFHGNRRLLMLQVLEDEPRSPQRLNARVPRDLETVCLKALAKVPGQRYASAGALAEDLRRFLDGEPVRARPVSRLERLRRWTLRNPLAAGVVTAVVSGSAAGWVYLTHFTDGLVERSALHSARMQAEVLEEVNSFYSELVFELDSDVVPITHEYATLDNALPLPATFTIAAGERISASASGMRVRLYSDYPFPWRADGGPHDEFERRALRELRSDPRTAVSEVTVFDGRPSVRYAKARVMQASCLGCHNELSSSPKTDWRVGDVRGVLEIIRPLEADVARTRQGLRGTFVLALATTLLALFSSAAVVLFSRRRAARVP